MKWRSLPAALAVALGTLSVTSAAHSQSFDFIYKDGKVTQVPAIEPINSINVLNYNNINLAPIFDQYVGNSFIYSSYNSSGQQITNLFAAEFPTNPLGITTTGSNQLGQTVGYSESIKGVSGAYFNGFIYFDGDFVIMPGAGNFTAPAAINDLGEIVGTCGCKGPSSIDGFLYSGGKFTVIDVPGAFATELFGINDSGEIVGAFYRFAGSIYSSPFVYSNGNYFGITGAYLGAAVGINDLGDVVGWGASGPVPEASTWAMMLLGFAGLGFVGYRASRKSAARTA
jgi:hypothetical protein